MTGVEQRLHDGVRRVVSVRAPLRLCLGGGGTDLPEYFERFGGYLISAAIDLGIRVTVRERGSAGPDRLHADVLRAAGLAPREVEALVESDVPHGSGLGSSGALAAGLVLAADELHGGPPAAIETLARRAYEVERGVLSPNAGRQDTLVAMFGGVREYRVTSSGVSSSPLPVPDGALDVLASRLLLVDTAIRRRADVLLSEQERRVRESDREMVTALHRVKSKAARIKELLCRADFDGFAADMHEHWMAKRERSPGMTTPQIDRLYSLGLCSGALGGKLLGAGGGGFLLMYAPSRAVLAKSYLKAGVVTCPVRFSSQGATIVQEDEG